MIRLLSIYTKLIYFLQSFYIWHNFMKPELFLIKEILGSKKIQNVLDMGAGKWYASLLCASYWATIDAVDNLSQKEFSYPELLKDHPNIKFHNLSLEEFGFFKMYDLIIMTNIIMFLDKKIFIDNVLPKIVLALSENWVIVLSFFGTDDALFSKTLSHYDINDFAISWLSIKESFDKSFSEDHPPYGLHKHHIHYLVLQKKLGYKPSSH